MTEFISAQLEKRGGKGYRSSGVTPSTKKDSSLKKRRGKKPLKKETDSKGIHHVERSRSGGRKSIDIPA